jgi:hypothetical protein
MSEPAEAHLPLGRAAECSRQLEAAVCCICEHHAVQRVSLIAHSWGAIEIGARRAGPAAPLRQIRRARSARFWRNSFTTAMIRGPLFAEPRGRGWYIANAEMREVFSAVYISKRDAVAAIRAMPAASAAHPSLFYTVKEFQGSGSATPPGGALMLFDWRMYSTHSS